MEKNPLNKSNVFTEYTCAICLQIIIEPVTTSCKHNFCYICFEEMKDNCISENLKCPMCRNKLEDNEEEKINKTLQNKIKELYPKEFNERYKILQEKKLLESSLKKIKIIYGNHHKEIEARPSNSNQEVQNKHEWTMFVKIEGVKNQSDLIEKVEFRLHPTFKQNLIVCKKSPFSFARIGWGTFDIPIKIYWKENLKLEPMKLNHELSFNGEGLVTKKIIKINSDLF